MNGIGSHQSAAMLKDEWLTPPEIIKALGEFALDPCAPVIRPWDTALAHYTLQHDGLTMPWFGRVWCNPPYGRHALKWLAKLADHGDGIALIFARTETIMFVEQIWSKASAILFLHGRLHFHHADGTRAAANSGAPSCLIAYGYDAAKILEHCKIPGTFIDQWKNKSSNQEPAECQQ